MFLCLAIFCNAQMYRLHGIPEKIYELNDSLSVVRTLDSLATTSYFDLKIIRTQRQNHQTDIWVETGKNYKNVRVRPESSLAKEMNWQREFVTDDISDLLKQAHKKLLSEGYAFNKVYTSVISMEDIPLVEIKADRGEQRRITGFQVRGYDKLPKRFLDNLSREFKNQIFNEKNIGKIQNILNNESMLVLEKAPQVLYTSDESQVYLFLKKRKANLFDGILGFGNDKTEKFTLNGSINLQLKNVFNGFESISVFWQRSPENAQTFNLQTQIPYLFRSNVGTDISMQVFRQDTLFANFKFVPAVTYTFNWSQKIGIQGYIESGTVTDSGSGGFGKDFSKAGVGLMYRLLKAENSLLMPVKSMISADFRWMKMNLSDGSFSGNQYFAKAQAEHLFHIDGVHYISAKAEGVLLKSDLPFYQNELPRFGGWNSLRGFNENFLVANAYAFVGAEYRILVGETAFFDVFGMGGYMQNISLDRNSTLWSVGTGFNIILPVGLMSFQLASGNELGSAFRFGDIKIHWGWVARF